jgi:hypothetical protein
VRRLVQHGGLLQDRQSRAELILSVPQRTLAKDDGAVFTHGPFHFMPLIAVLRAVLSAHRNCPSPLVYIRQHLALGIVALLATACGSETPADPVTANDDETTWIIGSISSTRWMVVGPTGIYETRDLGKGSWKRTGPSLGEEINVRPQPLTIVTIDRNTFVNLDGAVYRIDSWERIFKSRAEVFRLSGRPHAYKSGWVIASRDGGRSWPDTIRPDSAERNGRMFLGTAEVLASGGASAYLSNGWDAWRTINGGLRWERVPGVLPSAGYALRPDPNAPRSRPAYRLFTSCTVTSSMR